MSEHAPERLAAFLESLDEARQALSHTVTLIVVTKFHPASLVESLWNAGQRDFGENRHPEARDKAFAVEHLDGVTWHWLGQLQRKKARQVAAYAHVLHSIDSAELVAALEFEHESRPVRDAFVQVNLTSDPGRGGVAESEVEALAELVAASPALRLAGVMAVAPLDEPPGPAFARLAQHSERVRRIEPSATSISAGMSGDWHIALEHGATHLRIGTAITGERPITA